MVDVFPVFEEIDSPILSFGYLPTLYDAPANPHHDDGTWTASAFLVRVAARVRTITPLAGIRWGYHLQQGRPTPQPAGPLRGIGLCSHAGLLGERFPSWVLDCPLGPQDVA
jgi:hypothetical protein